MSARATSEYHDGSELGIVEPIPLAVASFSDPPDQ